MVYLRKKVRREEAKREEKRKGGRRKKGEKTGKERKGLVCTSQDVSSPFFSLSDYK